MLDSKGRKLEADVYASGYNESYLVTIDMEHHKVHSGDHYSAQDYDSDVDTGGSKYWHLITPDTGNRMHMTFSISASLPGLLELYESPTTTDNGTEVTPYNNDRNSSNTTTLQMFYDPTVSDDGTLLCPSVIGTEGVSPVGAAGGITSRDSELILRQDEQYLIKFTPFNDNTKISICLDFYEVEPKADDGA